MPPNPLPYFPIMKTTVTREITLTLDESEAQQLRSLMLDCGSLWDDNLEISDNYAHTVVAELWKVLNCI